MLEQSPLSDDLKQEICQTAWRALAQDQPQVAAEILKEYAQLTGTDLEIAEVWSAMLAWIDDFGHLERETRRLAQKWANQAKIVEQLVRSILKAWQRLPGVQAPADRDSLVGLGVDLIDFCLGEAPPSKPSHRASLYVLRARLLLEAGPLGDDRALSDYEIALSLCPEDADAWFLLSRHHLFMGRWDKSILAGLEAKKYGFDPLKSNWSLAVASTALLPVTIQNTTSLKELWKAASNDRFLEEALNDSKGRLISSNLERVRVSLHSHMIRQGGGWMLVDQDDWVSETVLVQALSPCHGRILHPCQSQQPADFDDLIIWDPQPVNFVELSGEQVPIMRALAVLESGDAVVRPYPKPRLTESQLEEVNQALPEGVFYYQGPETEFTKIDHGKLCWPRTMSAQTVVSLIERIWLKFDL